MSDLPDWRSKLQVRQAGVARKAHSEAEQATQVGARGLLGVRRVTNLVKLGEKTPLGQLKASVREQDPVNLLPATLIQAASAPKTDLAAVAQLLRPFVSVEV